MNHWRAAFLTVALTAASLAGAGEPASPPGHQAGEEAAVLAAMDRYLAAISASDLEAMAAMQLPEGTTYRALAGKDGKMDIVARPNSYWVDPARKDGHQHRERYWAPTVLIRGGIAVVWAPYEYWIDGQTSHCGVDVFDFVKIEGAWRVANAMWTVEPDACAELRPADASTVRPAG
jgi:hypothetical protein